MRMASELSLESVPEYDIGDRECRIHHHIQCALPVLNDAAMVQAREFKVFGKILELLVK